MTLRPRLALAIAFAVASPPVQAQAPGSSVAPREIAATASPSATPRHTDAPRLKAALEAARRRDVAAARSQQADLADPVARKLIDWALVDVMGAALGASELERAAPTLAGWPREDARRAALEGGRTSAMPAGPIPYTALRASRAQGTGWSSRRLRMNQALRAGDPRAAYEAIAAHGMAPGGADYAEAEAFAGWLALNKLRDPALADQHLARLEAAVRTPVSKARAAYWRGRAAEAAGDLARAHAFYEQGAQHTTTFHGQLAAQRAGHATLTLTRDPQPDLMDRATLESQELVRAYRLLIAAGEVPLAKVFALHLGDTVRTTTELAALMDLVRESGQTELSLLVYREAARRDLILHERGYPLIAPPQVMGGAENALVLAIVRQESQFDPMVRSHADARGMMQILPATGRALARKVGLPWRDDLLWDAQANMRLGSRYLGDLTGQFDGSYVLAAAGYNAGPGRPRQWLAFCGDPRAPTADPLDFIECIPFSETRNYVMNVMANLQIYRARLNGGTAPLSLEAELRQPRLRMANTRPAKVSSPGDGS